MAGSEFTQERVDKLGATQRIRDDLGAFVRTIVFFDSNNTALIPTINSFLINSNLNNESPVGWLNYLENFFQQQPYDFGFELWPVSFNVNPISTISCDLTFSGTYYTETDEGVAWWDPDGPPPQWEPGSVYTANGIIGKPKVNTVIGSKLIYLDVTTSANFEGESNAYVVPKTQAIKIISINDYEGSLNDPFNMPNTANIRAVRTGEFYHILPYVTLTKASEFGFIIFDYVSGHCTSSNIVKYMPKSSVEEICQIAARKILGTTADERYPIGNNEINQLNI
jgi:hypothetical protein